MFWTNEDLFDSNIFWTSTYLFFIVNQHDSLCPCILMLGHRRRRWTSNKTMFTGAQYGFPY